MVKQKIIIILGGGTGGLVAANELSKKVGTTSKIILIDKNDKHVYAPSFLWLMVGQREEEKIQKPLSSLAKKNIEFVNDEIVKINPENRTVSTKQKIFQYDYLIISLGAELVPEKIPGLVQSGYNLYQLKEVVRLREKLKIFSGGKVAIVVSSLPFKCPAAPYEAAFMLDEYFQKMGVSHKTEISIFSPETLPMPAAGPANGKIIKTMIEERKINFNPEVKLMAVDENKKQLSFATPGGEGDKTNNFDLLIYIPPHQGPRVIRESEIGNEMGWVPVDAGTLKTKYENVYAIGDVAAITLVSGKPLPKAGVFAHFEAEVVAANISSALKGLPAVKEYDGHAFCFLELGYGRSGLASGNFYAQPTPMVKLKRPGRIWHWGKILFEKYWLWKWF